MRRVSVCLVAALAALAAVTPTARASVELTVMSIHHDPPAATVVGDDLALSVATRSMCADTDICEFVTVRLTYLDPAGVATDISVSEPFTEEMTLTFTVPGEHVRYPAFHYSFSGWIDGGTGDVAQLEPLDALAVAQWPLHGKVALDTDHVVRMRLVYPDGAPAEGVPAFIAPARDGTGWLTTTGDDGLLSFTVPRNDPYLLWKADVDQTSNLFVTAFDNWPMTEPADDDGVVTIEGHGSFIGVVLNLGQPYLRAVDIITQDREIALEPLTLEFEAASSSSCSGTIVTVCYERVEEIPNIRRPISRNLGGGVDMKSTFQFGHSVYSRSSFLVNAGSGWTEGKGEVGSDREVQAWAQETGGPQANYAMFATWDYYREKRSVCHFWCNTTEKVLPDRWNTGGGRAVRAGLHDQARAGGAVPNEGPDWTVPTHQQFVSNVREGTELVYGISFGGSTKTVRARTAYTKATVQNNHAIHIWQRVSTNRTFHHRYVRNGWASDPKMSPADFPSLTFTDAANTDKTNPRSPAGGSLVPDVVVP